ncbi:MAG TPA: orotidine-5'-phosphate decarboxylase [Candidatus Angelobacter sp.]|nr:orotidine-5'-phosphate decarboxylase [Candidatus Angelobacter sp.]
MAIHSPVITGLPASSGMRERLIVALDVSSATEAQKLVARIGAAAGIYKVGLQLFTAEGPGIVRDLVSSGRRVFLDLKLHDIPTTVALAVKSAAELRVDMLTIHASGGSAMLRAATEAAAGRMNLLAVTVLTSLNDEDMEEIGVAGRLSDQVLRMANLARSAGCLGIVTSPREALMVRKALGEGFAIVTPGIRPAGAETNDQQRTATPAQAISNGVSHIVVGRPITHAADPAKAAEAIISEMEQARISR